MPEWSTACPDWERRIVARESLLPPPIYPDTAAKAVAFFSSLRIVDLPGRPTFGECSEPWVLDYVAVIFGAYDEAAGRQRIREFFLLISKKNGKSTIAAGIMLTALRFGWRNDDEYLIIAPTKEVADNSFQPAASMVRADPDLPNLFQVQDHIRTITRRDTRAALKVVAADTDTVSGKKAGHVLIDELWLFGKRPNAERMLMEATGGLISREEGWVINLSTQSDDPPAGVFLERLNYFRAVRDGRIHDPKSLGLLYEFPAAMVESKAYLNPKNFYVTNPNLGRSVSPEWLDDQLKRVRDRTDGSLQVFVAKHLDVQIGLALRADRWAGADFWEAAERTELTLDAILERSEVVTIGIDGGGLDDILGLAVLGRERDTQTWMLWTHGWLHPIALERRKSEAARYRDFEQDGDLEIVEDLPGDVESLGALVAKIYETGLLSRVGVDPEKTHGIVLQSLVTAGLPEELVIGISQGWRLVGAITVTERRLADGGLVHAEQRMMNWCVGNAKIEPRGNAVLITKQVSGSGKIDPLMATFDAVSLMALNPQAKNEQFEVVLL